MPPMRNRRRAFGVDLAYCSDREVLQHLRELLGKPEGRRADSTICPPRVAQHVFDLAHMYGQPAIVKIHAVNLLEDLVEKGGSVCQMTISLCICIAAKLNLSYNYVPLAKVQHFLKSRYPGEFSKKDLLIHEQRILVTLDFNVESKTILQSVEGILTLLNRVQPLHCGTILVEIAGYISCLYVLYRRKMPSRLKYSRIYTACALIIASTTILDRSQTPHADTNPHILPALSKIMLIAEDVIFADSRLLLKVVIETDKLCFPALRNVAAFVVPKIR